MRLALLALVLAPLAGGLGGCMAVAAGAAAGYGTVQYARNDDTRTYAADFPVVWPAALAAMQEAGFPVATDAPHGPAGGRVEVNDAVLEAAQLSPGSTRVEVRIGTFTTDAHRRVSAQIHDGIARRLGPPAAP